MRQVVFFDTPALTLNQHGLVVRARRIQGRPGDSVVKLRPVVPDQLPATLRRSPSFGVEVDALPGGFVCSGSMKAELDPARFKDVLSGLLPVRKLFTKQQRSFFSAYAPNDLELDGLEMLGPVTVLKLKFRPVEYDRRLVAEALELSRRITNPRAFDQVRSRRHVHRCRRGEGLPRRSRDRSSRRTADQDPDRARVLREGTGGGHDRLMSLSSWQVRARPPASTAVPAVIAITCSDRCDSAVPARTSVRAGTALALRRGSSG